MSDQDHLSAEYMQSKAIGLLARCGELTSKLQIMMRMRSALHTVDEFHAVSEGLVEEALLRHRIEQLRTQVSTRLMTKVSPEFVRESVDKLAPSSAIALVEHTLKEAEMLYEGKLREYHQQETELYQQAIKRAGLIIEDAKKDLINQGNGDDDDDADGDSHAVATQSSSASITDAVDDDDDDVDDMTRFNVSLRHLESLVPHVCVSSTTGDLVDHLHRCSLAMELEFGDLRDSIREERHRLDDLFKRRQRVKDELTELSERSNETSEETARRRIHKLKQVSNRLMATSIRRRAVEISNQMQQELDEAKRLRRVYDDNYKKMKKTCKDKGIDLDQLMLEELQSSNFAQSHPSSSPSSSSVSSSPFLVGGSLTPSFSVAFASDGSGRLLPVGRQIDALTVIGLNPSQQLASPGTSLGPDQPSFNGSNEMLQWSKQHIIKLRQRMDHRFTSLTRHIDEWQADRERSRRHLSHLQRDIESKLEQYRTHIRTDSTRVAEYRQYIDMKLQELAVATQDWHEKSRYYDKIHQESIVLLQRMGEEVESILA